MASALPASPALLLAAILLAAAALHDLATRTIPNALCLGIALCGAALAAGSGRLGPSLLAALAVFAAALALWLRRHLGGGDVKLLAACALLVPAAHVPFLLMRIAIAGGALALLYLALARLVPPPPPGPARGRCRLPRIERWRLHRGAPLPYAVAIAAGTALTCLAG
jgi:prepilin peptidase CpaA